jgi:hypothetical protein
MLIKTQRNGFIHGVPSEITPQPSTSSGAR